VLSEVKGLAALIEAFGQLSQRRPGARLALAGPADEAGLDHWRAFAREQAPNAMIDILGYLSRERWEGLLAAADLAVQLRTVSNGEASAAVCDCLAAGVPTIVTDLGWMSELPPSAVVHLPVSAGAELLAQTIEDLIVDQPRRIALSAGALAHTREHSFERVAAAYLDTLALA
jgi:glycosyltransferase involved in cell wall biosynthesis